MFVSCETRVGARVWPPLGEQLPHKSLTFPTVAGQVVEGAGDTPATPAPSFLLRPRPNGTAQKHTQPVRA